MNIAVMFPTLYLAAGEFGGKEFELTISMIKKESLQTADGKKQMKWVIYFAETAITAKKNGTDEKRLVLNKTNAKSIAEKHGNDSDDWIGKKIILYPTKCQAFGKIVDCIRIK